VMGRYGGSDQDDRRERERRDGAEDAGAHGHRR
jgi:hypothetical protein